MGRYSYYKTTLRSTDTKALDAIKETLMCNYSVPEDYLNWGCVEVKIKKGNRQQRHRFADTIAKLEKYISNVDNSPTVRHPHCIDVFLVSISEFSRITGRNRKTVVDWMEKDFVAYDEGPYRRYIDVKSTVAKLKKK